jgi:hypothetical protein
MFAAASRVGNKPRIGKPTDCFQARYRLIRPTALGRHLPSVSRLRGAANHVVATISEAPANKSTIAPRYHSDKAIN